MEKTGLMEKIRRFSALLIAISLVLPQRACVNGDQLVTHYPLSSVDSVLAGAVIVLVFLLPLIVLFFPRFWLTSLITGIVAVALGLYYNAYGATIAASSLLIGWYTYTLGAVAYLLASLTQLARTLFAKRDVPKDVP